MRCLVKSLNERNSFSLLVSFFSFLKKYNLGYTANYKLEEGENEVKPLWPLWTGLHACYNDNDKKLYKKAIWSQSSKIIVSSDYRLQFVYMKVELPVIANHHVAVKMYLNLAHTARQMLEVGFV